MEVARKLNNPDYVKLLLDNGYKFTVPVVSDNEKKCNALLGLTSV